VSGRRISGSEPDRSTFFVPGSDSDPLEYIFLGQEGSDCLIICESGLRNIPHESFQFDSIVAPEERDTFLIIYVQ